MGNISYEIRVLVISDPLELTKYVVSGIEEEGVPSLLIHNSNEIFSNLGIAVQVNNDVICIYIKQLPTPYLEYTGCNRQVARLIGENAARLVKKLPLKDVISC